MNIKTTPLVKIIVVLVIIAIPIWLSLSAVRLLLTDAFLSLEYNRASFPTDPFGMSREERLEYAPLAIDYLAQNKPITFLEDLRFPDGRAQYNERELRHMDDVQSVLNIVLRIHAGISLFILAITVVWIRNMTTRMHLRYAIRRGAYLTLFIIVTLVVYAAFGWDYFFTQFHQVFFESGTWRFEYSDTLIRLFPEQFWFDAALAIGGITTGGAILLLAIIWLLERRKSRQPEVTG